MPAPLRIFALSLASVVITAAVTPCPPNLEAHLTSATSEAADLSMRAKCPCSCSGGGAAGLATTHLDFACEREPLSAPQALAWAFATEFSTGLPARPLSALEAVPI